MAFLDFIQNRQAKLQRRADNSQNQNPENAKEMYARQDAQEKASTKPITPEIKAQADKALATVNEASEQAQAPATQTATDEGSAPHARLQNQSGQSKAQAPLSPTDGHSGKTQLHDKEKAPEKTPQRAPQTMQRRPPSWER